MKASVVLLLLLMALSAALPAAAQAGGTSGTPARSGLLLLDADESEGAEEEGDVEEEAEAEEEPEAAEEGSETQEAASGEGGASAEGVSRAAAGRHRQLHQRLASVRLTKLALTHGGAAALHRSRPQASSVCFGSPSRQPQPSR
jgi:hypothetical protein